MKTPRSDYDTTQGVLFFPRMLDKLCLKEQGLLPADYNYAGCRVSDCFDDYFCRFFNIDEPQLVARVRAGGSDDEILDWCFASFGRRDEDKIKFWNNFVVKRGWRDDSTKELEETKRADGLADRTDIQTWRDFTTPMKAVSRGRMKTSPSKNPELFRSLSTQPTTLSLFGACV